MPREDCSLKLGCSWQALLSWWHLNKDLMEVWEKVMQMSAERVPGRRNSQCKIPELRMCLECSWRGKEAHVAKEQCARCRVDDEVGEGMRPDHVSLWLLLRVKWKSCGGFWVMGSDCGLTGAEWWSVLRTHRLQSAKSRSLVRPVRRALQKSRREKRGVRVISKAFGPNSWKGATAITWNEDCEHKAALGIETDQDFWTCLV